MTATKLHLKDPTYQRVTQERDELVKKLHKLSDFIACPFFRDLPDIDQDLLKTQRLHMNSYIGVLNARLHSMETTFAKLAAAAPTPVITNAAEAAKDNQTYDHRNPERFHCEHRKYGTVGRPSRRYRTSQLNFGEALEFALAGFRIARAGWQGANMMAWIHPASTGLTIHGAQSVHREHWQRQGPDKSIATWAPTGSDTLAQDWYVVSS